MRDQEDFENGEFLILEDKDCHLVGKAGMQTQFTPSTLVLSNFHIFMYPQFDVEVMRKIAFSDITKFLQAVIDESPILDIVSEDESQTIHLFIPEENNRNGFVKLFQILCSQYDKSQQDCDQSALYYRKKLQDAGSIRAFYEQIINEPQPIFDEKEKEDKETTPSEEKPEMQFKPSYQKVLSAYDFVADLIDISPVLIFSALFILAAILSFVFKKLPFGIYVPLLLFSFICYTGIRKITGHKIDIEFVDAENAPFGLKSFSNTADSFIEKIKKRLFWEKPDSTIEIAEFLVVISALFAFFEPLFVLFITVVGLSFFDRWDPFRLGSLAALLSHLILW